MSRDEAVLIQFPQMGTMREDPISHVTSEDAENVAAEFMAAAVERGVKTVVEPSCMYLGRDVRLMKRVSEKTGIQIVPCTGIYTYEHLPMPLISRDADQIADLFIHDIEQRHPGNRHQGRFRQVRRRRTGGNRERREDPPRGGAREPSDRRADHGPLAPGLGHGAQADRDLHRGGRRPGEGADRPLRRLTRRRLHREHPRQGCLGGPRPLRHRDVPAVRASGSQRTSSCSTAATPTGSSSRRTRARRSTGSRPRSASRWPAAGLVKDWTIKIVHDRVLPALREGGMTEEQEHAMLHLNPVRWLTGEALQS